MIYFDNSATTKIDEHVLEAMLPWLREEYGNASSTYMLGRRARVAIESAREELASLINAHPAEIVFTSGGTEANNTVLKSCLVESALAQRIISSKTEHHAILHPLAEVERQGYEVLLADVDEWGRVNPAELAKHNSKGTVLSIMHANNETGCIQPLQELREQLPDVFLHSDAVQSFGKIPFDVQEMGLDFASFSAHKIHGPKGIGALFVRKGIDFKAHQQGGGQERNRRAGTEAVALIVGFQHAARTAVAEHESRAAHTARLVALLRHELRQRIPQLRINTPTEYALPHILNLSFLDAEKLDGEAILQMMDMKGIACSNGSACVSGTMQPSHVLAAMGRPDAEAKAAVRFSLSKDSTEAEVYRVVEVMAEIIAGMRS